MKNKLLLASVLLAMPAFAGTTSKEVIPAPAPQPQPSLWSWFIGGSVGYLFDAEEVMYTGHIGVDTPWNVGGWNVALFAELGYTEAEEDYTALYIGEGTAAIATGVNVETEVMPLTFNVKFERPLTGNLNAFVGLGLGLAFLDVSSSSPVPAFNNYSEDDQAFCGQVFAGLVYNVSESFEVFGGARWIYVDSTEFRGRAVDFEDDFMVDLGLRINF